MCSTEVCRTVSIRALSCASSLPKWRPHHPGHQLVQLHQPLEPQGCLHHWSAQSQDVSSNRATKKNCTVTKQEWFTVRTAAASCCWWSCCCSFVHQESVKRGCVCCPDKGLCSSLSWGNQRPTSKDLQAFPSGHYSSKCLICLTYFSFVIDVAKIEKLAYSNLTLMNSKH